MKKIILSLLLLIGLTATAQVASINPVDTVHFHGNGLLTIQRGDRNYLTYAADANASVIQTGRSLAITDHHGGVYTLFLDQDTLDMLYVNLYGDGLFTIEGVTCRNSFKVSSDSPDLALSLDKFRTSGIGDTLFSAIQRMNDMTQHRAFQKETAQSGKKGNKKESYSFSKRSELNFLWAFHNLGSEPWNGLMGNAEPAYDVRTSFSSYQLEWHYAFLMTKHWQMHLGVGYESDVYKYRHPDAYVDGDHLSVSLTNQYRGDQLRMVTRYVTLPVGVAYRTKGFKMQLLAIPGLAYDGRHTGLKHKGKDYYERESLSGALNPFKLDARLDMQFRGLGIFLQMPTQPLMLGGSKVYPIKLGFRI